MSDVELNAAERGFRAHGDIPLIGPLAVLTRWWERRHMELMAEAGYDDLRVAHNAVAAFLPEDGMRLTELAQAAGISKQAMAELVSDLVAKGYAKKVPDPSDGRAKIIIWDERGKASHDVTMKAFTRIEAELMEMVGTQAMSDMRAALLRAFTAIAGGPPQ